MKRSVISKLYQIFLILFLLIVSGVNAQDEKENSLTVYSGAVVLADPQFDSVSLVEFPFSLNRHEFEFFRPEGEELLLYSRIFAQIDLFNTLGTAVDSITTYFSVRANNRTEALQKGIKLFNKLALLVKPGVYSARLHVIDVVSKQSGDAFIDKIVVKPPQKNNISIGGPIIAFNVKPVIDTEAVNMRLVRNNFYIIPNPVSMFSDKDTLVYLYYELYNLDYDSDNPSQIQVSYNILSNDSLYKTLGVRKIDKPGGSAALAESFEIKNWPSDLYHLQIIATDLANNKADTSLSMFRILSTEEVALAIEKFQSNDPYDALSLKSKINLVSYIMDVQEKQAMDRLSDEGKNNFLIQYWKDKKAKNRFGNPVSRKDLIAYYKFANDHFSENEDKTDGWYSDRGRVLMSYGQWDQLESREIPMKQGAYEVWWYFGYKEGKVFIFEDWNGFMRLVHSNVDGEVYDDSWNDVIKSGMIDIDPDFVDEKDVNSDF